MYGTTHSSLQSSNTLNYWCMITHGASESTLYTVGLPLGVVNGVNRLTKLTTSKGAGMACFKNFRIGQSLSNRIKSDHRFEFESNVEASQVPTTATCHMPDIISIQSSSSTVMAVASAKLSTYGARRFAVSGPTISGTTYQLPEKSAALRRHFQMCK